MRKRYVQCDHCNGLGYICEAVDDVACPACKGSGGWWMNEEEERNYRLEQRRKLNASW